MKNYGNHLRVQEQWYEKLHDWEKAYDLYSSKLDTNPDDIDLTIGQMRCLEALGDWQALEEVARAKWTNAPDKDKNRMAHMGAAGK